MTCSYDNNDDDINSGSVCTYAVQICSLCKTSMSTIASEKTWTNVKTSHVLKSERKGAPARLFHLALELGYQFTEERNINEKLKALEINYFGEKQLGGIAVRIESLEERKGAPARLTHLALELGYQFTEERNINEKLKALEINYFGEKQLGGIAVRIESLEKELGLLD